MRCIAELLENQKVIHVRDALHDPQTTGKIELRRQTLNNRFLVGNYYLLGDLQN